MNRLSLEIHPEAIAEARAARQWYQLRSDDAAMAFLSELDLGMESIRTYFIPGTAGQGGRLCDASSTAAPRLLVAPGRAYQKVPTA